MKSKRTGANSPSVRDLDKFVSAAPQKKVYIHPDQLFPLNLSGNVSNVCAYSQCHESVPDDCGDTGVRFVGTGYLAIELAKKAEILRINHGPVEKPIEVLVGSDFQTLKQKFTLHPGQRHSDCEGTVSAQGKIVLFMGDSTNMPFIELVSTCGVRAMPDSPYQHSYTSPYLSVKILEKVRDKRKDMALVQKSIFPNQTVLVDFAKVVSGKKVRLAPAVVNGEPISYDDIITTFHKLFHAPDIMVSGSSLEDCINLSAFLLGRYGKNKNHRYNKAKDALSIDSDFVYKNNMGMEFQNKNKIAMGVINSIGIWPESRIDDADQYCKITEKLIETLKEVDIVTPVSSIPIRPDRGLFYFIYKYFHGFPPNRIVIEIKSREEGTMLKKFISMVHNYVPSMEIELIVNYPLHPSRWMSCLCDSVANRISSVLFTNYEDLFEQKQEKWETIFEPTELFLGISEWIEDIKDMKFTMYEPGKTVDRATYKRPMAYDGIEQYMINWLSDRDHVVVFESGLTMPRTYKIR